VFAGPRSLIFFIRRNGLHAASPLSLIVFFQINPIHSNRLGPPGRGGVFLFLVVLDVRITFGCHFFRERVRNISVGADAFCPHRAPRLSTFYAALFQVLPPRYSRFDPRCQSTDPFSCLIFAFSLKPVGYPFFLAFLTLCGLTLEYRVGFLLRVFPRPLSRSWFFPSLDFFPPQSLATPVAAC